MVFAIGYSLGFPLEGHQPPAWVPPPWSPGPTGAGLGPSTWERIIYKQMNKLLKRFLRWAGGPTYGSIGIPGGGPLGLSLDPHPLVCRVHGWSFSLQTENRKGQNLIYCCFLLKSLNRLVVN